MFVFRYFAAEAVLWAVGATAFVSFGLSIFAMQSKVSMALKKYQGKTIKLLITGILSDNINTNFYYLILLLIVSILSSLNLLQPFR